MAIHRTIIFIGPQGSGKGTQAKLLAAKTNAFYMGTGSIFRKIAKEDTEFGRYIRDVLDSGLLASDGDVEKVLHANLDSVDPERTIILDGVPRRLSQAEFLIGYMKVAGKSDIATFYINLPREEAISRMSVRRVCILCDSPTVVKEDMTKQECDACGGTLTQRADDMPDAINRRLDIFYRDTLPVLDYLKEHSDFYEIDGTQDISVVEQEIDKIIGV